MKTYQLIVMKVINIDDSTKLGIKTQFEIEMFECTIKSNMKSKFPNALIQLASLEFLDLSKLSGVVMELQTPCLFYKYVSHTYKFLISWSHSWVPGIHNK